MEPTDAAGTVQFKDGNTNIGSPVPVVAGVAFDSLRFLPGGQHSLTAVFTPANPAKFLPSTSNAVKFKF